MVAANYDHRMHLHASHEHMMSDEHFAREFKTLHFDIGRQVGKTSLILELARPSDMIVVHNRATQHRLLQIRGACRASIVTPTKEQQWISSSELFSCQLATIQLATISVRHWRVQSFS